MRDSRPQNERLDEALAWIHQLKKDGKKDVHDAVEVAMDASEMFRTSVSVAAAKAVLK
jgi:hypothetical protein